MRSQYMAAATFKLGIEDDFGMLLKPGRPYHMVTRDPSRRELVPVEFTSGICMDYLGDISVCNPDSEHIWMHISARFNLLDKPIDSMLRQEIYSKIFGKSYDKDSFRPDDRHSPFKSVDTPHLCYPSVGSVKESFIADFDRAVLYLKLIDSVEFLTLAVELEKAKKEGLDGML